MGTMPEKYEVERKTWTRKDSWLYDIYAALESVDNLKPQTPAQEDLVQHIKNELCNLLGSNVEP